MNKTYSALFIKLCTLFLLLGCQLSAQQQSSAIVEPLSRDAFEVMRQFFEYDKSIPLEYKTVTSTTELNFVKEKFSFRGHLGEVPAYLALPKSVEGPYPVVLLIHGLTSSKESWWERNSTMGHMAQKLLESGYGVLTLDAQYHGERSTNNELSSAVELLDKERFIDFRDMVIESVIDYRRALDYLETRSDIDSSRIGVIGYSMGGMMTFMLTAVDHRVKTAVSCVSPIVDVPYMPTSIQNYAPFIEQPPFLMLMAENDTRNYNMSSAKELFDSLATKQKILLFYPGGHMLPERWTDIAQEWIIRYLK